MSPIIRGRRPIHCVLALGIVTLLGCGGAKDDATSSTKSTPAESQKTEERAVKFPPRGKAALVVDAKDFRKTIAKQGGQLDGQLIEVTGKVKSVDYMSHAVGGSEVTLVADRFGVRCVTKELDPWKFAVPGQQVTIQGVLGFLGVGDIEQAVIVDAGPNPLKTVDAHDLLKLCQAKSDAVPSGTYLIVTGKVARAVKSDGLFQYLVIKGAGGRDLLCKFSSQARNLKDKKVGDQVKILGQFDYLVTLLDKVGTGELNGCVLYP